MRSPNDLILLSGPASTTEDRRLLAFASWMGVPAKSVSIPARGAFTPQVLDGFEPGTYCLAISAETLAGNPSIIDADLQRSVNERSTGLLVFGCLDAKKHLGAISRLTSGIVCQMQSLNSGAASFLFPAEAISLSRQLAGLSYAKEPGQAITTFELRDPAPTAEVIMAANGLPVFFRMRGGPCEIFLLSMPLPDLNAALKPRLELQEHYHRLIPLLIFLRHSFGERCWHGPKSTARLIIDDPLLTVNYGFLDHNVLTNSMQRTRSGTSIAFIPWNYWRTSRENSARLLRENSNLAVCVHGCDHTNKEFEIIDSALLARKAALALHRMEMQRERTGAAFEPVMVFPQGRFSRSAIAALRSNDYLAAVNSTVFPTDSEADDLKVADLLQPAVMRYDGFPIFQRRYPHRLFDFAFDLFLGKPALVVEHHEYFRDGCHTWEEFVAALYKLDSSLRWPGLTAQLMRSCRKRKLSNDSLEIQFYTRKFQLENDYRDSKSFLLRKYEPDSALIESVLVDGKGTPFSCENGFLELHIQTDPGKTRNIEIVDREHSHDRAKGFGVVHNARVLLRRGLSEFRDNTLARHDGLLKIANGVARGLKVTGDA
jgi:hypothetical protein